jgi:KaiC/GvpD/RAD55 family RecA-like ATPase
LIERVPTGINALDQLVEGGIPKATSGIIVTDKRSPGGVFAQQILWNCLQHGLNCAYFQTRYSSEREFFDEMAGNGRDVASFAKKGSFRVNDYVALAQLSAEEEKSGDFVSDSRKVEGKVISAEKLTMRTKQAAYDFAVYDDIDLLFHRLSKPEFVNWAETIAKLQKDRGSIALAIIYQQNLPEDIAGLIDRLGTDCTIELRTDESPDGMLQHYFRVTRMKATNISRHGWIAYMTSKEGITTG